MKIVGVLLKGIKPFTNHYKPGPGLPLEVIKHVKSVYQDLSKTELLEKCLHGKTQNANESFHGTIWNRIHKTCHVGKNVFELGIFDAVAHFNIGRKVALDMQLLKITPGYYTTLDVILEIKSAFLVVITKSI